MPFQSEKQRRYLWANEPEIARDWTDTYGSRIRKDNGGIMDVASDGDLNHTFENYIKGGTTYAIPANILSGDFDITQDKKQGITFRGDGEYFMSIRRFIPDFLTQTGTTRITLYLRDYPNSSQASSTLGPFDITSSTTKQDTRARARSVALKVENTAVDQNWKLGTFRLDVQASGRR